MTQDEETTNITPITRRLSHSSTLRAPSDEETELQHPEQADDEASRKLTLSESEALAYARTRSKEQLPIHLTFAPNNDRDNPRNWPKWRKWYTRAVVSMLNVLTC